MAPHYSLSPCLRKLQTTVTFHFNLTIRALQAQSNSPLIIGSEIEHVDAVTPTLQDHPLWEFTSSINLQGSSFLLKLLQKIQESLM
jgi:hypothetical protein